MKKIVAVIRPLRFADHVTKGNEVFITGNSKQKTSVAKEKGLANRLEKTKSSRRFHGLLVCEI